MRREGTTVKATYFTPKGNQYDKDVLIDEDYYGLVVIGDDPPWNCGAKWVDNFLDGGRLYYCSGYLLLKE